ncbi:protein FAR1-RELATED SEQUENCE 4-like [Vigna radiata var. radiata]|uniref:Protein FAR1-RELATED SEQUENCE 4-like n=1 Tax=Vigna radiata var. radiata TaxID=3916 RepID=A0A1S3UAT0_VIGRR|nr:protein FAR1-RELATED SEQUENCE 4-like [Vigna radiata var. radiata]
MVFESVNQAKPFYRQYVISKGFGIRTTSSRKNNKNKLCYFMMVCSKARKYVASNQNEIIGRPTLANDCAAQMIVSKRDEKWYILAFDDVHTHDISPTKSRLFQGGYENMEFVEQDVRNYVAKQRRALSKDGDVKALLNHFSSMREFNKDFFFDIDVDDDNHILNVFWADARSRTAYNSSYYKVTKDSIRNEIREERVATVQSPGFMSLLASLHNDMQNTQSSTTNINNVLG